MIEMMKHFDNLQAKKKVLQRKICIFVEGEVTEFKYFEALIAEKYLDSNKVRNESWCCACMLKFIQLKMKLISV